MSLIEAVTAPGGGPPWHSHSREDEVFYVISGTADVRIGNEVYRCQAGDRLVGHRNIFHTCRDAGHTDLRMVIAYAPGDFEQSIADATAMAAQGKDQAEIGRMLAEKYGITRSDAALELGPLS